MAICTIDQLTQALGKEYEVSPLDGQQARILVGGGDIAFIALETGGIETQFTRS